VTFADAPGGRGTEVRVDLAYEPPAGPLGVLAARIAGEEPALQVPEALRNLKQVLETGVIAVAKADAPGTIASPAAPKGRTAAEVPGLETRADREPTTFDPTDGATPVEVA
jgi:hypothetical protein